MRGKTHYLSKFLKRYRGKSLRLLLLKSLLWYVSKQLQSETFIAQISYFICNYFALIIDMSTTQSFPPTSYLSN